MVLVRFDREKIDVSDYWAVKQHCRGRLEFKTFQQILKAPLAPRILHDVDVHTLPDTCQAILAASVTGVNGIAWELDTETLCALWLHPRHIVYSIQRTLECTVKNACVCFDVVNNETGPVWVYIMLPCVPPATREELPSLSSLIGIQNIDILWYSVTDIFTVGHNDLRIPDLTVVEEACLSTWLQNNHDVILEQRTQIESTLGVGRRDHPLRSTVTRNRSSSMMRPKSTTQGHAIPNGKRWSSVPSSKRQTSVGCVDVLGVIKARFVWVRGILNRLRVVTQSGQLKGRAQAWIDVCNKLIDGNTEEQKAVLGNENVQWFCAITLGMIKQVNAKTTRHDNLRVLYTALIWHIARDEVLEVYIAGHLRIHLLQVGVAGIPGFKSAKLQKNTDTPNEWCVACDGGSLTGLMTAMHCQHHAPLYLDIARCNTSDHTEIQTLYGIETVMAMFQRGQLSRALGISEAPCNLLVDHIAHRGHWRGISRTSILTNGRVFDNMTIEDPTKHVKVAAFIGTLDSTKSASSSIMVGNTCYFGTGNGFDLMLGDLNA